MTQERFDHLEKNDAQIMDALDETKQLIETIDKAMEEHVSESDNLRQSHLWLFAKHTDLHQRLEFIQTLIVQQKKDEEDEQAKELARLHRRLSRAFLFVTVDTTLLVLFIALLISFAS